MLVKDQIVTAERQQESARKDLEEFQGEVVTRQRIGAEESARLARHRQNQQRVTRGLERAAEHMARILRRMEDNRVGDQDERQWLGRVHDELDAIGRNDSGSIEEDIRRLREEAERDGAPADRLQPLADRQRQVERALRSLALRLTDYGDVNAVIQQWREILKKQMDIRDRVKRQINEESRTQ
jgi:hypothetical protein